MSKISPIQNGTLAICVIGLASLFCSSASAIPSFAAQTGQPCSSCHIGAFGPQLKPYGRDFKLYGYVTSDRPNDNAIDNWYEKASMMVQTSFTTTQKNQSPNAGPGYGPNNNFSLDQVALYYGGRITSTVGGIAEFTYDAPNKVFTWDALDVRHAFEGDLFGTDYVAGVLLGNQLGNTSMWNSTPPNGFPYNSSRIAPTPAAGNLFDDTLNSQILGPGAYISWNDWIYAETTIYFPLSHNFDQAVGATQSDHYVSAIPFWHLAVQHDFFNHEHYFQVGTFGATADRFPNSQKSPGNSPDHVTDIGLEANYQWFVSSHDALSAHATYIHENEELGTTSGLGNSNNGRDHLDEFKIDATYSIQDTYVPSVQYFRTTGSTDANYWGTANGSPNSEGYTLDLAYVPFGKPDSPGYNWGNMRVALEYTGYTKFNGTSSHASDNNTVFLNLWFQLAPFMPFFAK